jgi:hypothetical protein
MKISKLFAGLFGIMGLAVAGCAVMLALDCRSAKPLLLVPPEAAQERTVAVMDAACRGDYDVAASMILGNPQFGMEGNSEDPVEAMVWELFCKSFSYTLEGPCYATEDGLAQRLTVSYLKLDSVTEHLRSRTQGLMEQRIIEAEDVSEIYNDNNEFKESFVMAALLDAARQAVREDADYVTVEITVNMIYGDGQWWLLPDTQLLSALSGGIMK